MLQVVGQAGRRRWHCHSRQRAAEGAHFGIEGVALVAASGEEFLGLDELRFCCPPGSKPGEAIGFAKELVRVGRRLGRTSDKKE
jgi:hypothetical protein